MAVADGRRFVMQINHLARTGSTETGLSTRRLLTLEGER